MERLRKLANLTAADRRLALEAAAWLAVAQLQLWLVPFRRIASELGQLAGPGKDAGGPAGDPVGEGNRVVARQVGRAVERAARHVPWRSLCLPRAMAARRMLRRRGIPATLHFGVRLADPEDRRMAAHAWLTVGTTDVVGTRGADSFAEIACFTQEKAGTAGPS